MKKKNKKGGNIALWIGLAFATAGAVILARNKSQTVATTAPEAVLPSNHATGSYASANVGTETTTTTRSGSSSAHR